MNYYFKNILIIKKKKDFNVTRFTTVYLYIYTCEIIEYRVPKTFLDFCSLYITDIGSYESVRRYTRILLQYFYILLNLIHILIFFSTHTHFYKLKYVS